jgi:arylsulfatase A-like enzyme
MTLNKQAVTHARKLIKAGKVVHDELGDWTGHQLSAAAETAWLKSHGWNSYGKWHLGVDSEATPETKGRFGFPFSDFRNVRRSGVIAAESRASQNDHADIAKAAKGLLDLIDKRAEKAAKRATKQKKSKKGSKKKNKK